MQTFLPFADYQQTASLLDYRRLGKQRVETYQILKALTGQSTGWVNHPATNMWRGYENELCQYGATMSLEWLKRGYKDTVLQHFLEYQNQYEPIRPWWLGYEPLHTSHKSNLYRKDAEFYKDFAHIGGDLPYVWCHSDGTYHLGTDRQSFVAIEPAAVVYI